MKDLKFVLWTVNEIPKKRHESGSAYSPLLEQFVASGVQKARVEFGEKGRVDSAHRQALHAALKKSLYANEVALRARGDDLYLERI